MLSPVTDDGTRVTGGKETLSQDFICTHCAKALTIPQKVRPNTKYNRSSHDLTTPTTRRNTSFFSLGFYRSNYYSKCLSEGTLFSFPEGIEGRSCIGYFKGLEIIRERLGLVMVRRGIASIWRRDEGGDFGYGQAV